MSSGRRSLAWQLLAVLAPLLINGYEGGEYAGSAGASQNVMLASVAKTLSQRVLGSNQEEPHQDAGNRVFLEIYFGSTCGHCLSFIKEAVYPLVHAKLPGDRVKLTFLPWVPDALSSTGCLGNLPCSYARAMMCALNSTMPQPIGVDSPALKKSLDFVYCDLSNTAMGATPPQNAEELPKCAEKADMPWTGPHGLKTCAEGDGALTLLAGTGYRDLMDYTKSHLEKLEDQVAPFVFLNNEVLVCPGPEWCTKTRTKEGDTHLETPGSLLKVVCSKLKPAPKECNEVLNEGEDKPSAEAKQGIKQAAIPCENCAEVGAFHWSWHRKSAAGQENRVSAALSICAVGSLAAFTACAVVAWRSFRPQRPSDGVFLLASGTCEDRRSLIIPAELEAPASPAAGPGGLGGEVE